MTRIFAALLTLTLAGCAGLVPEPRWHRARHDRQAWAARNRKLADEVPGRCILASQWDQAGNPCGTVLLKCKRGDGAIVYEFSQDARCAKKEAEVCR